MLFRLLLLFTLVPLVELALLLLIGDQMGLPFTLGLVIVTGVVGAWLARQQGLRCWREVQRKMSQGQLPAEPLLDGLMILVAGALLLTPGVLTDALGFALLLPPIRKRVRRYLAKRFKARITVEPMPGFGDYPGGRDDAIDVEHHPSDE